MKPSRHANLKTVGRVAPTGDTSRSHTISVEPTAPNVLTVRVNVDATEDFEQWVLLTTDVHLDNPKCDQALHRKHLLQAVERNAGIIDAGDLFCAMQGKYDKRSNKSDIRPEHQGGDYLDALVRTASEHLSIAANNLWVIGRGNHESSIKNKHETDLTERLVALIRAKHPGSPVTAGGYTGWVRFLFNMNKTRRRSMRLWYCHGWGGGGPVTINTIQAANRMPMMVEGADIIFTGHVHERWCAEKMFVRLNEAGRVEHGTRLIVQGSTYKEDYQDGKGGWHVETGKPPKPIGAWWLRFTVSSNIPHAEVFRAN